MSPLLKDVEKAGLRGVRAKRNPAELTPEDFFTESQTLRSEFAKLVNISDPQRVAIIPSVSYGISSVAKNIAIGRGEHILVAAEQFPSNVYPWQKLCDETGASLKVIEPDKNGLKDRGKIWNEKILNGIDANTKAVAIAHTHWADGTKFNLEAIRKRTREVGALLIVDGTQSVGALPFDVDRIQPDALICAGYKWLLGPYSIGLAYFGERFDDGKPLEENWINRLDSEDFSALINYQSKYQPGALRYEVGEHSNFVLVPMALSAIKQINKWHVSQIQEYCESITENQIIKLREKGFWVEEKPYRASHLFGVRPPKEFDLTKMKSLFLKNKIYVSFRGDAIRVSPNIYNDESDMRKFVKVLTSTRK